MKDCAYNNYRQNGGARVRMNTTTQQKTLIWAVALIGKESSRSFFQTAHSFFKKAAA